MTMNSALILGGCFLVVLRVVNGESIADQLAIDSKKVSQATDETDVNEDRTSRQGRLMLPFNNPSFSQQLQMQQQQFQQLQQLQQLQQMQMMRSSVFPQMNNQRSSVEDTCLLLSSVTSSPPPQCQAILAQSGILSGMNFPQSSLFGVGNGLGLRSQIPNLNGFNLPALSRPLNDISNPMINNFLTRGTHQLPTHSAASGGLVTNFPSNSRGLTQNIFGSTQPHFQNNPFQNQHSFSSGTRISHPRLVSSNVVSVNPSGTVGISKPLSRPIHKPHNSHSSFSSIPSHAFHRRFNQPTKEIESLADLLEAQNLLHSAQQPSGTSSGFVSDLLEKTHKMDKSFHDTPGLKVLLSRFAQLKETENAKDQTRATQSFQFP